MTNTLYCSVCFKPDGWAHTHTHPHTNKHTSDFWNTSERIVAVVQLFVPLDSQLNETKRTTDLLFTHFTDLQVSWTAILKLKIQRTSLSLTSGHCCAHLDLFGCGFERSLNGADHTNWRQGHQGRKKQQRGKLQNSSNIFQAFLKYTKVFVHLMILFVHVN